MKTFFQKFPSQLRFIILVYLTGIIFFSLLRFVLILVNFHSAEEVPLSIMFQAKLMGWRFDTVISGYFLILPLVIFFITSFFRKKFPLIEKIIFVFLLLIYSVALFICAADIPWFAYNESRLTVAALHWTNTPLMMLKFIFEDIHNYPYLIGFVVLIFLFYKILKRIKRNTLDNNSTTQQFNYPITTITYSLFILLTLLGIRSRVAIKSPIRWGTAFFSQYNFANQVGLNPVYTFMRSWLDSQDEKNSRVNYMDEKKAIENVRSYYGMDASTDSPIANFISTNGDYKKYNIVLVLMESMSVKNLTHFGNENHLTPNLDSLFDSGISFTNFYSDGNHTFNGIYSSLFGFPSLPLKHSLKNMENQQPYGGIAKTLLLKKYETIFFTTHDEQFDNMSGFLLPNGFETLVSQKDYPSDKIISTLGVPDHVQFDEVIKRVSQIHESGKQFFAGVMTASNHSPYIMPKNIPFKAHTSKDKTQMIEYSDWAIGYFLSECRKQSWFDSTIFIFTGDHGNLIDGFEHYTAYHNIPFIIYAPKIFSPKVFEKLGGQIDIYPTVMSLLNLPFINNSFGIDLFHDSRKFLSFTYDGELCCTDGKNLFVLNQTQESFYKISEDGKSILPSVNPALSDSMKIYSESIMQTLQWMIEKRMME